MKKHLTYLLVSMLLIACGNENEVTDNANGNSNNENTQEESTEVKELRARIHELEMDNARKDTMMYQTAKVFDEIAENLSQISYKQGRIRRDVDNIEMQEDPKEWIKQEIAEINRLREENAGKIAMLQSNLKTLQGENSNLKAENESLKNFIEGLNNTIAIQEKEIEALNQKLENLDNDYKILFEEYLDMADMVEDAMNKLNTAYYAYGTKKELRDNGVITKEGGFIGIGRTNVLKSDFNDKYFNKIDITQTKEIEIMGTKPKMVTTHPESSYSLEEGDESSKLLILDAEKFWGASKYLVLTVQ